MVRRMTVDHDMRVRSSLDTPRNKMSDIDTSEGRLQYQIDSLEAKIAKLEKRLTALEEFQRMAKDVVRSHMPVGGRRK